MTIVVNPNRDLGFTPVDLNYLPNSDNYGPAEQNYTSIPVALPFNSMGSEYRPSRPEQKEFEYLFPNGDRYNGTW
jgi:hypothetical protein